MLSAWDKYEQGLSTEARQSSFAIKQTTEFVKNVLRDGQFFEKFKIAVADGNLGEMKRVWESATLAQQNRALEFDDYILFTSSAAAGKLDVLRQLYSYASPNQRKGMLNANGFNTAGVPPEYIAFIMASHNGHLPVVNQVRRKGEVSQVLRSSRGGGDVDSLSINNTTLHIQLFSWADVNQRAAMLNTNFCEAFWVSCRYNRVEVVKRIWELGTDEQKNKMLLIDNYRAFRLAGEYAHTEVLKLLWEFAGGSMNRNDMIKAWEAHKATTLVPIISEGGVAAHIKTTDAFLLQIYTKSKATKTTTTTTTLPRLPKAGVFR